MRKISVFPAFFCGHCIILGTRLGQRDPSMFSNKLNCSQRPHACKILAQSPEPVQRASSPAVQNSIRKAWLSAFERAIIRLSDLNSLGEIAL